MQYFLDSIGLLQFMHLLDDEVLSVLSLAAHLLLDWLRIRAYGQVVLNNFLRDSGEAGWFPGEHIRILSQEFHEVRLLLGGQLGADDDVAGRVGS